MAEIPVESGKSEGGLETLVGICVVLLATFMAICSVKGSNIGQKMQQKQVDRNNNWMWYQARNIRQAVYEATADEMSVPWPGETSEGKKSREQKSDLYRARAKSQEEKSEKQKADAEQAERDYETLSSKDDQFDLAEAAMALGLAMMGVTVLLKRRWLFVFALVPAVAGVGMGIAGFLGMDTNHPAIKWVLDLLG